MDVIKIAQIVTKYLVYSCWKIYCQELSKFAQYGRWSLTTFNDLKWQIWENKIFLLNTLELVLHFSIIIWFKTMLVTAKKVLQSLSRSPTLHISGIAISRSPPGQQQSQQQQQQQQPSTATSTSPKYKTPTGALSASPAALSVHASTNRTR